MFTAFKLRAILLTLAAIVVVGTAADAVPPGEPSKTAIMAATFRAIGARNPDATFRNPDYLAARFLRPDDLALLAANGLDMRPQMAMTGQAFGDYLHESIAIATNFVRTVHIDASMRACLDDGATQVVVLGAGLDSRAYRFGREFPQALFFELDFPPTQAYKIQRVREVLGRLPKDVRYVPIDFTKDDLRTTLLHAGYRERAKTFFVWEGVVHYIPESAVRATLRFVAEHAVPGSQIVFDYPFNTNHRISNRRDLFARWGEPFVFGFPPGGPRAIVQEEGLQLVSDLSNYELVRKYAVRPDGTSSLRIPNAANADADDAGMALAEVPQKNPPEPRHK